MDAGQDDTDGSQKVSRGPKRSRYPVSLEWGAWISPFRRAWQDPPTGGPHRSSAEPAAVRGPRPTESELHLSVASLLDWVLLPPAVYTTFPAGWGVLTPMMAQRLRRSGLKQGMPDVLAFHKGRCVGIELKAGKNGLTSGQRDMHYKLAKAGVPVYVAKSLEGVLAILRNESFPLRPTGDSSWPVKNNELPLVGGQNERACVGS